MKQVKRLAVGAKISKMAIAYVVPSKLSVLYDILQRKENLLSEINEKWAEFGALIAYFVDQGLLVFDKGGRYYVVSEETGDYEIHPKQFLEPYLPSRVWEIGASYIIQVNKELVGLYTSSNKDPRSGITLLEHFVNRIEEILDKLDLQNYVFSVSVNTFDRTTIEDDGRDYIHFRFLGYPLQIFFNDKLYRVTAFDVYLTSRRIIKVEFIGKYNYYDDLQRLNKLGLTIDELAKLIV